METPSTPPEIPEQLRQTCQQLAAVVTAMHPLVNRLADTTVRGEVLRALFEITKQVETVKKQMQKLEKRDSSPLL